MAGRSLEQAQNAILYCLGRLNRGDRFNIIRFATEAESLFPGLTAAAGTNLRRAEHFVRQWQAGGGTNCEEALQIGAGRSRDRGTSPPGRAGHRRQADHRRNR